MNGWEQLLNDPIGLFLYSVLIIASVFFVILLLCMLPGMIRCYRIGFGGRLPEDEEKERLRKIEAQRREDEFQRERMDNESGTH